MTKPNLPFPSVPGPFLRRAGVGGPTVMAPTVRDAAINVRIGETETFNAFAMASASAMVVTSVTNGVHVTASIAGGHITIDASAATVKAEDWISFTVANAAGETATAIVFVTIADYVPDAALSSLAIVADKSDPWRYEGVDFRLNDNPVLNLDDGLLTNAQYRTYAFEWNFGDPDELAAVHDRFFLGRSLQRAFGWQTIHAFSGALGSRTVRLRVFFEGSIIWEGTTAIDVQDPETIPADHTWEVDPDGIGTGTPGVTVVTDAAAALAAAYALADGQMPRIRYKGGADFPWTDAGITLAAAGAGHGVYIDTYGTGRARVVRTNKPKATYIHFNTDASPHRVVVSGIDPVTPGDSRNVFAGGACTYTTAISSTFIDTFRPGSVTLHDCNPDGCMVFGQEGGAPGMGWFLANIVPTDWQNYCFYSSLTAFGGVTGSDIRLPADNPNVRKDQISPIVGFDLSLDGPGRNAEIAGRFNVRHSTLACHRGWSNGNTLVDPITGVEMPGPIPISSHQPVIRISSSQPNDDLRVLLDGVEIKGSLVHATDKSTSGSFWITGSRINVQRYIQVQDANNGISFGTMYAGTSYVSGLIIVPNTRQEQGGPRGVLYIYDGTPNPNNSYDPRSTLGYLFAGNTVVDLRGLDKSSLNGNDRMTPDTMIIDETGYLTQHANMLFTPNRWTDTAITEAAYDLLSAVVWPDYHGCNAVIDYQALVNGILPTPIVGFASPEMVASYQPFTVASAAYSETLDVAIPQFDMLGSVRTGPKATPGAWARPVVDQTWTFDADGNVTGGPPIIDPPTFDEYGYTTA